MELGNAEAIPKLVEAGLGLPVSSAMAVKAAVRAGTLVAIPIEPPLSRRLGIVRRRDKPESPALGVLLSALEKLGAVRDSRRADQPDRSGARTERAALSPTTV